MNASAAEHSQKTVSALTSGDVPDLIFMDAPSSILPQNAYDDKIVDVSDVVAPYELREIPDVGHFPHVEAPGLVTTELMHWAEAER